MKAPTSKMADREHHRGPTLLPIHERYETLETVGSLAFQNSPKTHQYDYYTIYIRLATEILYLVKNSSLTFMFVIFQTRHIIHAFSVTRHVQCTINLGITTC